VVPSDNRLDRLHQVIQVVMGWEGCHLHEFSNGVHGPGELCFGPQEDLFDDGLGPELRDETKATRMDLAPSKGSKIHYWYDFGDDWLHDVTVKSVDGPHSEVTVPVRPTTAAALGAMPTCSPF
jgi:hypothetical protein